MLPDFIVACPCKTGSRWIYESLREHPSISMAKNAKGTRFFEKFYDRGIGWYENFFNRSSDNQVMGEVDETYFSCLQAPERMHSHIPNVKLICCLRNPIERTFSAYLYFHRLGVLDMSFEESLCQDKFIDALISDSMYFDQLSNYLKYFPSEQISIILFDDLQNEPAEFVKKIYAFLGVDDSFEPDILHTKVHEATAPRSRFLNKVALRVSRVLRDWNMLGPFYKARNSKLVQKIMFSKAYGKGYPTMSDDIRKNLQDRYADQIKGVSELIKKDLSHWK